MRIYPYLIALTCLSHCATTSAAPIVNPQTTTIMMSHQTNFANVDLLMELNVLSGPYVAGNDMYLIPECGAAKAMGSFTVGTSAMMIKKATTLTSGEALITLNDGRTLHGPNSIVRTNATSFPILQNYPLYSGYGTNFLRIRGLTGVTPGCKDGINWWMGWINKPAGVAVYTGNGTGGNQYVNHTGGLYYLAGRSEPDNVTYAVDVKYPQEVRMRAGETTGLMEVGSTNVNGKIGILRISVKPDASIAKSIEIRDGAGTVVKSGTVINVVTDGTYRLDLTGLANGSTGPVTGNIVMEVSAV